MFAYLRSSLVLAILGIGGVGVFTATKEGSCEAGLHAAFIVAVLAVLEVSLSFDNAVVNASVLREMDEVWRKRFLTWGMLIAVVGMRIVLPVLIVAVVGNLSPTNALILAVSAPAEYARVLQEAHVSVSAFGGSFLAMVGLQYFFDQEKDIHWIQVVEAPLIKFGRIQAIALLLVMLLQFAISRILPATDRLAFLTAGTFGLMAFIVVDGIATLLKAPNEKGEVVRTGLSAFLYLEVLDASFSFDGVIGAFALSTNLIVIAVGLGIGAIFVRSLTILFVERGVLGQFRYLEHGAFYAIIALGVVMFIQAVTHLPEVVSGLIGAVFIGLSLFSSVRHRRAEEKSSRDQLA